MDRCIYLYHQRSHLCIEIHTHIIYYNDIYNTNSGVSVDVFEESSTINVGYSRYSIYQRKGGMITLPKHD